MVDPDSQRPKRKSPSRAELEVQHWADQAELALLRQRLAQEQALRSPLEMALQEARNALEQRVAERTAELMQANALLRREIAERSRAEAASRESAARLRAIAHAVPDVLLVLDEDGRYVEVLTSQPQLLYTDPDSLRGRLISEVLPPPVVERVLKMIRQTLATGQMQIMEYELHISQVGRRLFECRAAPIEGTAAGKPAVAVVARDITQRQMAEEQLRQAQKMEAVGRLTGGMAHDFNNLLAIIQGNLELLHERLHDASALQDLARRALAAVARGTTLNQRLLAFSRRQPLQPQSVQLNRLVKGLLELLRRTLGGGTQVSTRLTEPLWTTVVDPGQLETALLNLALNARDAMSGHGQLTIETANIELDEAYACAQPYEVQAGPYVLLRVRDSGGGMPPQVLARVFEPFFTTKPVGKGSGLGLSMVYGLVKQLGGYVNIASELGQGTTVTIYLPRAVESGE
jgi:PAS domain S-box-containing protein